MSSFGMKAVDAESFDFDMTHTFCDFGRGLPFEGGMDVPLDKLAMEEASSSSIVFLSRI